MTATPIIFVWTHGGRQVNITGTFNGWHPEPLEKQGNYYFLIKHLEPGVYFYKFVVDGVWLYDLGQLNEDDGSGNWNNVIEIGGGKTNDYNHHAKPERPAPVATKKEQQQQQKKEQQPKKEQQQQQPKKEQQQQQPKGRQQPKKTPEPVPEPVPEPLVANEVAPEPVVDKKAPEPSTEPETPATKPAKAEKVPETVVTIDVVAADVDSDVVELEKFVRSFQPTGLFWEGSQVSDYVFGMKKLTIICRCKDDVSVEDLCRELEKNEDLVGSAQIQSFSC